MARHSAGQLPHLGTDIATRFEANMTILLIIILVGCAFGLGRGLPMNCPTERSKISDNRQNLLANLNPGNYLFHRALASYG